MCIYIYIIDVSISIFTLIDVYISTTSIHMYIYICIHIGQTPHPATVESGSYWPLHKIEKKLYQLLQGGGWTEYTYLLLFIYNIYIY